MCFSCLDLFFVISKIKGVERRLQVILNLLMVDGQISALRDLLFCCITDPGSIT